MSKARSEKCALCVGVLCLGLAFGASAQPAGAASGSSGAAMSAMPGGAGSAGSMSSSAAGAKALSSGDRSFVQKAAIGGLAEVQLGNLAQQKASNDAVKQFGARMVEDHSKANDELKQIASAKGIAVPSAPDKKHEADMNRLQKLSGAAFDKAYMSHMVDDHKHDVAEFKKEAGSGKDADLKGFAAKTLPTLEEHLKMAQSTNSAVKTAGK
jgi:putative membrane protein